MDSERFGGKQCQVELKKKYLQIWICESGACRCLIGMETWKPSKPLEMMPFCGFNTSLNCRALVSPAISSNLVTLNWILCIGPGVLWERRTLFSEQRVHSGHLVNENSRGNISLSPGHGEKVNTPQDWLPSFLHQHPSASPNVDADNWLSHGRNDALRAIKPHRPTFIITGKWRAECLTSCFPLICLMVLH